MFDNGDTTASQTAKYLLVILVYIIIIFIWVAIPLPFMTENQTEPIKNRYFCHIIHRLSRIYKSRSGSPGPNRDIVSLCMGKSPPAAYLARYPASARPISSRTSRAYPSSVSECAIRIRPAVISSLINLSVCARRAVCFKFSFATVSAIS